MAAAPSEPILSFALATELHSLIGKMLQASVTSASQPVSEGPPSPEKTLRAKRRGRQGDRQDESAVDGPAHTQKALRAKRREQQGAKGDESAPDGG